jgi:hypothetical protein
MRTWKILAGAALLFLGTVASFKCLGDIKRPLLGNGASQHTVTGNVIGFLLFGLLPLVMTHRLWQQPPARAADGARSGRRLATIAMVTAMVAIGSQAMLGPVKATAAPSDLWYGLLVIVPLSIFAATAAAVALMLAMISLSFARQARGPRACGLVAAAVSVLVTCP